VLQTLNKQHASQNLLEPELNNQGQAIIDQARTTLEPILKPQKLEVSMVRQGGERIVQVILKFAQEHSSSLIVIGTHGRSGMDRLLLGSVAEGVMHHADVPVLLMRSTPPR
jgi:nucleotide-binding universal stress UspA family protein